MTDGIRSEKAWNQRKESLGNTVFSKVNFQHQSQANQLQGNLLQTENLKSQDNEPATPDILNSSYYLNPHDQSVPNIKVMSQAKVARI